jgi:hypothetical protein
LCKRNLQIAAHPIKLLRIDAAVDHPIAIRADTAQRTDAITESDAIGHVSGGHLWRPARQTVDPPRTTRLLCLRSAIDQESSKVGAFNQRWTVHIDGSKASPQPVANRILMDPKET